MAIITYPLNGIDYNAENAETYLCTRTSGVYSAEGNFQASVTGDRQVSISAGLAWIQNTEFAGKSVCNTESVAVEIPLADGTRPRIDRIVLRFDKAANASSIVLKQGTPSSAPAAPTIERTELVYELGLCTVQVPAASTIVSAGNVTSTLLDESVCGLMRDGVTGIPTEQLQEQVTALLADLRVAFENQLDLQEQDFYAWFETIKGKLGDDPATALQSQVDDLQAAVGGIPLELSAGTNSIQIVADENRVGNVEIKGFTTQTGSGDASPSNVREIKNAGIFNALITITGTESGWYRYTDPGNGVVTYVCPGIANGWVSANVLNGLCSEYKVQNVTSGTQALRGPTSANPAGTIIIRDDSVSTLQKFKEKMAQIKPVVAYLSTESLGKFYTGISVEQGDNYHCTIVELKDRLHKGDTLQTSVNHNGELKCIENHIKHTYVFTGDESCTKHTDESGLVTYIYSGIAPGWTEENALNATCSAYEIGYLGKSKIVMRGPTSANPAGTIIIRNDTIASAEELNAQHAALFNAGTPVVVEYDLASPEIYANTPVIVDNPQGTYTVSSEDGTTVSVGLAGLVSENNLKSANTYSTEEVNTGKTWIDGKPIYRKSYAVAAFPNKGFVNVPLNISNLGQVVDYYGIASDGTNTIRVPYYSVDGDTYGIQMSVSENSTLVLKTNTDPEVGGDRSDFSGTVTVEYTKS